MSLINEALKRARVEAARQDAAARGVPASALPVYVPPRRRPWLAPVAGFLAGLTVVAMAAGAFWLVRRPVATAESSTPATSVENAVASLEKQTPAAQAPSATQNPATSPAHHETTRREAKSGGLSEGPNKTASSGTEPASRVSSSRLESSGTVEPVSASPEPLSSSSTPAARTLPRQAVQIPPPPSAVAPSAAIPPPVAPATELPPPATPAAPPAVERPTATVPSPAVAPEVPPPAVAPVVPAPAVPPPASSAGDSARTYLREAAPAGPSVKLEFIVWSESQPFAQINGQLLSVGQSVEDYTLLTVERERVELEGGGVRFWLRVR